MEGEVLPPMWTTMSPKKRNNWSMMASSIKETEDKTDMYSRVLEVAKHFKDNDMITRLEGVPASDLVAVEARYHSKKNCYARYLKSGTIKEEGRSQVLDKTVN